jgi:acetyl-CoA carboxylase carboxyl transferase subunit alpha
LKAATTLKQVLLENLEELNRLTAVERRQLRYEKFRKIGVFTEVAH